MAVNVLIDTNVLLNAKNTTELHSTHSLQLLDAIEDGTVHAIISTITIAELCIGYYAAGDMIGKQDFLAHINSSKDFVIADLNVEIADTAAKIRAETSLGLPDAIIVATGLAKDAQYIASYDQEIKKASQYMQILSPKEILRKIL
jgi:predicted nucleic acid-binding protein